MQNFVPKGWGFEKWIVNNDKYCGKLLYFVKGKKCSLHYHKNKEETFYVQSGEIRLYFSYSLVGVEDYIQKNGIDRVIQCLAITHLKKGDTFHLYPGTVHQMLAMEDTELFEFSTHHDDEDSYRIVKGD